MTDNRTEAQEWAEESEDNKTLAITHALLYIGDQLADLCLELNNRPAEQPVVTPKLAKLLAKDGPFPQPAEKSQPEQPVPAKRFSPQGPRHDPAAWVKLSDGRWKSPTGRRYQPWTRQAFGVITARRKLGLPI